MLTWMEDSRPQNLTLASRGEILSAESDFEVEDTQILQVYLNNRKQHPCNNQAGCENFSG